MTAPRPPALLEVRDLVRHYRLPRERLLQPAPLVQALQGVSFALPAGGSLGIVGESGSGKSTLARLVMALEPPTAGQVLFDGQDLNALPAAGLRRARAGFQMVFQDPFGSLDPRQPVWRTIGEPLAAQGGTDAAARRTAAVAMLDAVGLRAADADKYPHEFSGGQRQRIAIARALVTRPRLIVADEPVSALDVSVQAQVLNLMQDLRDRFGLALLFISHDLAVVDLVCDEVIVLYQGRVVEQGSPATLFTAAAHPYTRALMDAVPRTTPRAAGAGRPASRSAGDGPATPGAAAPATPGATAAGVSTGCPFAPRCGFVQDACRQALPPLAPVAGGADGHRVACFRADAVLRHVAAPAGAA